MIYGYVRVSSETQVRDGHGLEVQRDKIHAYALSRGLDVEEVYTDAAESGSTPLDDRPAGRTLLSVLKPGDHVIVSSLDRAWRSLIDASTTLSTWRNQKVTVHILNMGIDPSSPMGTLFFHLLAAFAEFERALIQERITSGVRAAIVRRGGQWGPNAPYGWRRVPGAPPVEVPEEQEVLALVRTLRRDLGPNNHAEMARVLNRRGILNRAGKPWNRGSVEKTFRAR